MITSPDPIDASAGGACGAGAPLGLAVDLLDLLTAGSEGLAATVQARLQSQLPPECLLLPAVAANACAIAGKKLTALPLSPGACPEDWVLVSPASFAQAREWAAALAAVMGRFWQVRRVQEELRQQAMTDELTGLANSRRFRLFLEETLAWSRHSGWPVTLLLFDIDNFKQYNEQYGHGAGDRILKQTAALLRLCSRADDLVARLSGGGDEFAVVFWDKGGPRRPRQPANAVQTVASPLQVFERFKKRLESEDFPDLGPGGLGRLTISAGMAVFPSDAADADTLIAKADEALMSYAKRLGKNRLHIVGQPGA